VAALRLEEANKAFHEYLDIDPNGKPINDKLKLSVFLLDGLAKVSGAAFKESYCFALSNNCRLRAVILTTISNRKLSISRWRQHVLLPVSGNSDRDASLQMVMDIN
jgi:hypothetical protein